MKTGIISSYYSFLESLYGQRRKFAFLQLIGRLEEYLVKELIYHIYLQSKGKRFALTNIGGKGQQKVDIAVLSGDLNEPTIVGLIEAKYVRNWHRAWPFLATDETTASLKSLARQLGSLKSKLHGRFKVDLASRSKDIYGLVIASFVSDKRNDKEKKRFFSSQLTNRAAQQFRYHDLSKPYFRYVYDDVRVRVLDGNRFASLKIGLRKLVRQSTSKKRRLTNGKPALALCIGEGKTKLG